jgi:hypothetical protein
MGWACSSDGGHKKAYIILMKETIGKRTLQYREENWEDNIKIVFSEQNARMEGIWN